jgi:hypothetical protein
MTKNKVITIVDCFVSNKTVEVNLKKSLEILKSQGHEILLVSNTRIEQEILRFTDYHFYDSRNQLFKKEYPGVSDVDFWTDYGSFVVHNVKSGVQKHGLSVLINIFNCLKLAKSLGYTHFQRFETDDLFGPDSLSWIKSVPNFVNLHNKKGLFYTNPENIPADASFHYFYCEIDYFIEVVPTIQSEEDYEDYLTGIQGNRDFRIVEVFLYDFIMKMVKENMVVIRDGKTQMTQDFPDTVWNTISSSSNLSEKYRGCLTGIYKVFKNGVQEDYYYLYSSNFIDNNRTRKIIVELQESKYLTVDHNLEGYRSWCYHQIPTDVIKIRVFENDELLFEEFLSETKDYIELI